MSIFQPFAFQQGPSAGPSPFPYEANLLARYTFNEGSGTTVLDQSGNGVNLVANNGAILGNQTPGIFSGEYAADFSGGSYVCYNVNSPFGCAQKIFTYSFWTKFPSNTANQYLGRINRDVGCGTSYGQGAWILGYSGSALEVFSAAASRFTAIDPAPINTWIMTTLTYSGIFATGQVKAYINGVFVASNPNTLEQEPLATDVVIGASTQTGQDNFGGLVDQWSLHNFEMTSIQITELYNWYVNNPNFIG